MNVVSKFLTAEVTITAIRFEQRRVVIEGVVKQLLPMTVSVGLDDARIAANVLLAPARARLARWFPGMAETKP